MHGRSTAFRPRGGVFGVLRLQRARHCNCWRQIEVLRNCPQVLPRKSSKTSKMNGPAALVGDEVKRPIGFRLGPKVPALLTDSDFSARDLHHFARCVFAD
jgi:hypothetical protein